MTLHEVLAWIESHKDEKVKHVYEKDNPFRVVGIKLTDLRQFAKSIGIDHELAKACFDEKIYETMMLATMLADFTQLDIDIMENWAIEANQTHIIDQGLVHLMMQRPFDFRVYLSWCKRHELTIKYAGYTFLSSYFRQAELDMIDYDQSRELLNQIVDTIQSEPLTIQNAMNNAVVMAGLHVPELVRKAQDTAQQIGYILPLKVKNKCNVQSASDYLIRYKDQPKFSRVARLKQMK